MGSHKNQVLYKQELISLCASHKGRDETRYARRSQKLIRFWLIHIFVLASFFFFFFFLQDYSVPCLQLPATISRWIRFVILIQNAIVVMVTRPIS